MDFLFSDGEKHCEDWYPLYQIEYYSVFIIAALVSLMNVVLHLFFNFLVRLVGRPKVSSKGLQCRLASIFAAQFVNTVVILTMVYHSFMIVKYRLESDITDQFLVGPFTEFSERWYLLLGSAIVMTMIF